MSDTIMQKIEEQFRRVLSAVSPGQLAMPEQKNDVKNMLLNVYDQRLDRMGDVNMRWGVCGVVSCFYALYQKNPALRSRLAKGATDLTMILAEIKTFLRTLEADGKLDILKEIEEFTQTFPGFKNFSIQSYINHLNDAAKIVDSTKAPGAQTRLLDDSKFGIAMPPKAVVYFLQQICDFPNARSVGLDSPDNELVLGLFENGAMTPYDGLKHWVYYLDGTYYSWGKRFASIAEMNFAGPCCKIAF